MNQSRALLARIEDGVATPLEDLVLRLHRPVHVTRGEVTRAECWSHRIRWPCDVVVGTLRARDARRNRR